MPLVEISQTQHRVVIALAYATANNITGAPVYRHAICYLNVEAAERLAAAVALARPLGWRLGRNNCRD